MSQIFKPLISPWLAILIIFCFFISCDNQTPRPQSLTLLEEYDLSIPAPSGLSFGSSTSQLLVVSDAESRFYRISTTGQVIGSIAINADDLEGIVWNEEEGQVWVLDEAKREMIQLSSGGNEIGRISVVLSFATGNQRLEGITLDPDAEKIYLVNERDPGLLAVLDYSGDVLEEHILTWAEDFSGLFYDANEGVLWVVSDQSKLLAKCDLEGKPIELYELPFEKAEGVVLDMSAGKVYIVNDETGKLYVFGF
jgi:uncharacterized protein YjiK